jgi:hypothetical protein
VLCDHDEAAQLDVLDAPVEAGTDLGEDIDQQRPRLDVGAVVGAEQAAAARPAARTGTRSQWSLID